MKHKIKKKIQRIIVEPCGTPQTISNYFHSFATPSRDVSFHRRISPCKKYPSHFAGGFIARIKCIFYSCYRPERWASRTTAYGDERSKNKNNSLGREKCGKNEAQKIINFEHKLGIMTGRAQSPLLSSSTQGTLASAHTTTKKNVGRVNLK